MTPRVGFVNRAGPMLATYRYRSEIPARELAAMGWQTSINSGLADVVVFGKPYPGDDALVKEARGEGAKVVVDITDPHFGHPLLGPIYTEMCRDAHLVTTPSKAMAEVIRGATGRDAHVIVDPVEFPRMAPHAGDGERLLWFGNVQNIPALQRWFPALAGRNLRIVTGPQQAVPFIRYTPQVLEGELAVANIVLLPSRPGGEYKGPNRLVNSLWSGCWAVCGELESYEPFKQFVFVGEIDKGLDWAEAHRRDLNDLVAEAQDYVAKFYTPAAVAKEWDAMLRAL